MSQSITWQRTYGEEGEDVGYSIVQTYIGDFIMCGYNQTSNTRIIRVNELGNVVWNKIYGGNVYDKIIQTNDSNFVLVGSAIGITGIGTDGYIIKIDKDGNLLWWKKYGGSFSDYFHDVLETNSGDLIIVGTYTTNEVPNIRSIYLIKTDNLGNQIWDKKYDSTGSGFNVDDIPGKGYLLSGTTEIYVDKNGEKKYSKKSLGINGLNNVNNNGFVFFDNKDTNGTDAVKINMTDTMFNVISTSWISIPNRLLFANKIIKDKNHYIIGGENISFQGDQDAYVMKIDSIGNLIWDKIIPPRFEYNEGIYGINNCSDSGFISIGFASPFIGETDFLCIKTDKNGNTTVVSVLNNSNIIDNYNLLYQNYPNPFNPKSTINYELGITNFVKLKVYDALGNEVAILVNEKKNAGSYSIEFDGNDFASGVYFYKLEAGEFVETKRMILLK